MANIDFSVIRCSNPDAIKAFAFSEVKSELSLNFYEDDGHSHSWAEGFIHDDGLGCFTRTRNGVPHGNITRLSAAFPDDVILAHFEFESEWHDTTYEVEYSGGAYTETAVWRHPIADIHNPTLEEQALIS